MNSLARPIHKEQAVSLVGPSQMFMSLFTKSFPILFIICLTTILSAFSNNEDQIDLTCKIYSASSIGKLEIVKNGELIATFNNIELVDNQALINTEVSIEESCWIVARCFESRDDNNVRFAHSSPIFFKVKEQPFKLNQESINWFINQTRELIKQAALKYVDFK